MEVLEYGSSRLLFYVLRFSYLCLRIYELKSEGPLSFLHMFEKETQIDASLLKFFYDRLKSLFNTLQITEVESYTPLTLVADFCTLVATYW